MTTPTGPPPSGAGAIRHGRQASRGPASGILRGVGAALAVVLVSAGIVGTLAISDLAHQVSTNAIDISNGDDADDRPAPVPRIGGVDGGFDFLLVGTDNDADQGDAFGDRDGATLNDVNILLHVSADHRSGVVVSFPRDLVVAHPRCVDPDTGATFGPMTAQPLNTAFDRGGLGCVAATVSDLTGLDVDYAGTISFFGVIHMTDAIGGVPVCLASAIDDPYAGLKLPAGTQNVSGATALAFLRSRHGVGDGSDLARISSQQAYMASLMRTMKSADTLGDPAKLYGLARTAATNIKLSSNLAGLDSMVALASAMKDVDLDHLTFVQYPGTTDDPRYPGKVVPLKAIASELFERISADEPFTLPADSIGAGAVAAPTETPAPAVTTPPTTAPAPSGGTPTATGTADDPVIPGLVGSTASTETCAKGR